MLLCFAIGAGAGMFGGGISGAQMLDSGLSTLQCIYVGTGALVCSDQCM